MLRQIEEDLQIGAAAAGLLTTAPVLMFALLTPLAALVIRRAGAELALLLSLSGVLLGTFVRAVPGFGWMLAGMFVIGASVTIGNVVVPVIIRRDVPPARVGFVTAAYAAMLNAGSLLTSLLTAPIAAVIGWPSALLVWSGITVAGIGLWGVHLRLRGRGDAQEDRFSGEIRHGSRGAVDIDPATVTGPLPVVASRSSRSLYRRPVTWLLLGSFAGQTTIYYALSTWLPTIAADELGTDPSASGALASLYQGVGIFGALLIPVLTRFTPRLVPALVICGSWLVLTTGLLFAPELLWLWVSIGAIGHAGRIRRHLHCARRRRAQRRRGCRDVGARPGRRVRGRCARTACARRSPRGDRWLDARTGRAPRPVDRLLRRAARCDRGVAAGDGVRAWRRARPSPRSFHGVHAQHLETSAVLDLVDVALSVALGERRLCLPGWVQPPVRAVPVLCG